MSGVFGQLFLYVHDPVATAPGSDITTPAKAWTQEVQGLKHKALRSTRTEKIMQDTVNPQINGDDKGPTEKLRDDEKAESGVLVPRELGVPGAQKPDNEEIKDEKGLNTE